MAERSKTHALAVIAKAVAEWTAAQSSREPAPYKTRLQRMDDDPDRNIYLHADASDDEPEPNVSGLL